MKFRTPILRRYRVVIRRGHRDETVLELAYTAEDALTQARLRYCRDTWWEGREERHPEVVGVEGCP